MNNSELQAKIVSARCVAGARKFMCMTGVGGKANKGISDEEKYQTSEAN